MKGKAFIVLVLLLSLLWPPVSGQAQEEAPYESATESLEIPEPKTPVQRAYFFSKPAPLYLEQGGDVKTLLMPENIVADCDTGISQLNLKADWCYGDFDSSILGTQDLLGAVQLPKGYAHYDENGAEADIYVSLPITVIEAAEEPKKPILRACFYDEQELLFLEKDGDLSALPLLMDVVVFHGPGFRDFFFVNYVDWRYGDFNTSRTGRQNLMGKVVLPADYGYFNESGEEIDLLLPQPVLVYDPDGEAEEEVDIDILPCIPTPLIPLGSSRAEAEALLEDRRNEKAMLRTRDGYEIWCDYTLDMSRIDLDKQGAYQPFTLHSPPGVKIAEDELRSLCVYVIDPNEVDLTAASPYQRGEMDMDIEWLYSAQSIEVWYTDASPVEDPDAVSWQPYAHFNDTTGGMGMRLQLGGSKSKYLPEGEYWFQVWHETGKSNYLYVDLVNMTYKAIPVTGDRNGGDREPGGSNEIPDPPEKPTAEAAPPEPEQPTPQSTPAARPGEAYPTPVAPANGGSAPTGRPSSSPPPTPSPAPSASPSPLPTVIIPSPSSPPAGPVLPSGSPAPTASAATLRTPETTPSARPTGGILPSAKPTADTSPATEPAPGALPTSSASPESTRSAQADRTPSPEKTIGANTAQTTLPSPTPPAPIPPETLPPLTQPPGALPQEASVAKPKGMAFTGEEIEALKDIHGDTLPFSNGDSTVWIPESILEPHANGESGIITVLLEMPSPRQVELRLWAGDTELTGPFEEAFAVIIPWRDADADCTDAQGESVACRVDADRQLLTLNVHQTGVYTLHQAAPEDAVVAGVGDIPSAPKAAGPQRPYSAANAPWYFSEAGLLAVAALGVLLALSYARLARRRGSRS